MVGRGREARREGLGCKERSQYARMKGRGRYVRREGRGRDVRKEGLRCKERRGRTPIVLLIMATRAKTEQYAPSSLRQPISDL